MIQTLDPVALAAEIKGAQDHGGQLDPVSRRLSDFDMAAAYDIARHIHDARMKDGVIPVGRKIGFTNSAIWSQLGIDEPVWAIFTTRRWRYSTVCTEPARSADSLNPKSSRKSSFACNTPWIRT